METYLVNEFQRQSQARRAPAYEHLRRTLQHAIENGELTPGQALPGERELGKLLDLSRVTVRKAIAGLVGDGLLLQRQGGGIARFALQCALHGGVRLGEPAQLRECAREAELARHEVGRQAGEDGEELGSGAVLV